MIVDVRHGLTGEGVLQFETESNLSGWDLMVKIAAVLGLQTTYQVTVNPERMINDMSPLHVIQPDPLANRLETHFIVRPMQYPTAAHYRQLIAALYQKNAVELSGILSQGLDLSLIVPDGGHTSALVALAMIQDHDSKDYTVAKDTRPLKYPSPNTCLTFLILQAKADPNILPPKQQPTTMIGLAVALGNQALVKLLIGAGAEVHPEAAMVPPLIIAVLNQDRNNVRTLLGARADPWRSVHVGALVDRPWSKWAFSGQEPVCAVQVAAAQSSSCACTATLINELVLQDEVGVNWISPQHQPVISVLSEQATMLLSRAIKDYQHYNGPHKTRLGHESLRWRKIMAGLYLPTLPTERHQLQESLDFHCPLLHQID